MQHRTLLELDAVRAALVALAEAGLALTRPGLCDDALTAAGHEVFATRIRAALEFSVSETVARLAGLTGRDVHRA